MTEAEEKNNLKAALKAFYEAEDAGESLPQMEDFLWDTLLRFQKHPFQTAKGLEFTYEIRGYEMFVDRKEKSITRATVNMAFHKALEIQRGQGTVSGPKKLGTFGASYLYPVFIHIGVIEGQKGDSHGNGYLV